MNTGKDIMDYAEAFQRGEEKGFTFFFNSLYPALLYYSFRILNDKILAEDVVIESFAKIWKSHDTFDHPRVIKTWMYTTCRNGCLNLLQSIKRQQGHLTRIGEETKEYDEKSALSDMILAESTAEVHRAIKYLPPECKKIFKFLFVDGWTVREIANHMKLSISTIKTQKARGLELLRKKGFLERYQVYIS